MQEFILNGDGNNSLWLMDEKDNDVIYPAQAVITDKTYFEELMSELKDTSTYVIKEDTIIKDLGGSHTTNEHVLYYVDGTACKYGEIYDDYYFDHGHRYRTEKRHFKKYINPRGELFRVLNRKFADYEQLLLLFQTLGFNTSKEARLQELRKAREMFDKLSSSNLDSDTIKLILNRFWPSFGLFATEGLKCIDFEADGSTKYSLEELRNIIKASVKANVKHHKDIDALLKHEENARENTMTLSLARNIHNSLNK